MPLEQYAEQFHKFQLTDEFRRGRAWAPSHTLPAGLAIDPPPAATATGATPSSRSRWPTPRSISSSFASTRTGYPSRRGPISGGSTIAADFAAKVRLCRGVNRFYAMAGRPGDIDARSEDVEIPYNGPDPPGRLHVLALGVKDYSRNALRFASVDATRIADHLHQNGIDKVDRPGQKIVLTDGDVTERSVKDAFATLRSEVKGRPEDVVVVFLAGHTDVLKDTSGRERFSLLLSPFPFPPEAPLLAFNRGVGVAGAWGEQLPPGSDLPFHVIYRNLSRLEALQRMVIIDACQAEAIFNDPGVRQIEEMLENDTRRVRTSYLLAARRGEAANESGVLEHGLLTYVLLRGMQAPGLKPLPVRMAAFEEAPNADRNSDGFVTSQELREYADRTLPELAASPRNWSATPGAAATAIPRPPGVAAPSGRRLFPAR